MSTLKPDVLTEREYSKMAKKEVAEEKEEKTYRKPVLFLYKSKAGKHLYAFNMDREDGEGKVLGGGVESLVLNISDVEKVVSGEYKSTKISVMETEGDEKSPSDLLLTMVRRAEEEKKKAVGAYGEPQ